MFNPITECQHGLLLKTTRIYDQNLHLPRWDGQTEMDGLAGKKENDISVKDRPTWY